MARSFAEDGAIGAGDNNAASTNVAPDGAAGGADGGGSFTFDDSPQTNPGVSGGDAAAGGGGAGAPHSGGGGPTVSSHSPYSFGTWGGDTGAPMLNGSSNMAGVNGNTQPGQMNSFGKQIGSDMSFDDWMKYGGGRFGEAPQGMTAQNQGDYASQVNNWVAANPGWNYAEGGAIPDADDASDGTLPNGGGDSNGSPEQSSIIQALNSVQGVMQHLYGKYGLGGDKPSYGGSNNPTQDFDKKMGWGPAPTGDGSQGSYKGQGGYEADRKGMGDIAAGGGEYDNMRRSGNMEDRRGEDGEGFIKDNVETPVQNFVGKAYSLYDRATGDGGQAAHDQNPQMSNDLGYEDIQNSQPSNDGAIPLDDDEGGQ